MKRRYLSILLPACFATLVPAFVDAAQADTRAGGTSRTHSLAPAVLAVADIPATLAATGGNPTGWITPVRLRDTSPTESAGQGVPLAAWVASASLSDGALRAEVRRLFDQGAAILVTSFAGEARHELATFGFEPIGRVAIYRQTPDGLDVTSVTADFHNPDAAAAWQKASDTVLAAMLPSEAPHFEALRSDGPLNDEIHGDRAFLRVDDQTIASNGRSASQTIRVMRDTTASHDYKVIAVEAAVHVIPHTNGVLKHRDDENSTPYFERVGEGFYLFAPNAYRATTVLQWQGDAPAAQLLQAIPKTSGATNRKITEDITSKSTLTASITPEYARGLNKDGIFYQGKVPFSLAFASETSERSAVEMNVEDYSVSATAQTYRWGLASTWTFPLANDISGNPDYFGTEKLSTRKMTPMMREASLATASEWRVDGDYEQTILIASRGTVENRRFTWSGVRDDPDRGPRVFPDRASIDPFSLDEKGLPWEQDINEDGTQDGDAQPWVVSKIDLSSPYLTRSPTILIQSLAGLGECLQADDGMVELAACDKGDRSQQWSLEADSTYRNRADGACLTTAPGDGSMTTTACAANTLNQQWKWSADRIHSMYDGGETWRLHVHAGAINAKFDASRHQRMAPNPNHFLLRPWSSYPSAPSEKDWVPTLSGRPSDFQKLPGYEYREVETTERWQTIALRHGL